MRRSSGKSKILVRSINVYILVHLSKENSRGVMYENIGNSYKTGYYSIEQSI